MFRIVGQRTNYDKLPEITKAIRVRFVECAVAISELAQILFILWATVTLAISVSS